MKLFCETAASDILPALRALLTKELTQTYALTQVEISKKLGITQPAISQYKRELRGHRVKTLASNEKIMDEIKKLSADISLGKIHSDEIQKRLCFICRKIMEEKIFTAKQELGH